MNGLGKGVGNFFKTTVPILNSAERIDWLGVEINKALPTHSQDIT